MIKVVWFLKKSKHLSMEEFRHWWINEHAPQVVDKQGSMLRRYIVNIRHDNDDLPGLPEVLFDWDGIAEEWFSSTEAAHAAFSLPSALETRADVMQHVDKISRCIVDEHHIIE